MLKNSFLLSFFLMFSLNGCFTVTSPFEMVNTHETQPVNADNNNQNVRENNLTELANPSGNYGLTGMVKDLESKKPLEKVKVLMTSDTGLKQEVFTDKDGFYHLDLPRKSKASLTFSLEYYQSQAEIVIVDQEKISKETFLRKVIFINP